MKDPLVSRIVMSTGIACLVSAVLFLGLYPRGSSGLILTGAAVLMNVAMGFLNYRRLSRAVRRERPGGRKDRR